MDLLSEIIAEVAAEIIDDDDDDVFYDAEEPSLNADELTDLWDEDISRRYAVLASKKDDVLDRVISLIADVPSLRREVTRLREEVTCLKTLAQQKQPVPPLPQSSQSPPPPPPAQGVSPSSGKKRRRRRRKRKSAVPNACALPTSPGAPLYHSTPAPNRHLPPSQPPPPPHPPPLPQPPPTLDHPPPPPPTSELPYTSVTHPSQRPHMQRDNIQNIHFYHDSNNKYTTKQELQTALDNIHEMTSKPRQNFNIILHKTFTLQRTLNDIKQRNLSNSIIIIDTTTNNAKHDNEDQSPPHETHNTLRNIIITLQHKHNIANKNIIILETIPSLKFDIHSYNLAAATTCRELGVRFCSNLVGESHLFLKDGIHVLHQHRPLLVKSVAAAVVGIDPHRIYRLQRPPLGPNGPWRYSWGSQNRPVPTTRWPPPGLRPTNNRFSLLADFDDT